jgi:hypothetical protein
MSWQPIGGTSCLRHEGVVVSGVLVEYAVEPSSDKDNRNGSLAGDWIFSAPVNGSRTGACGQGR